MPEASTATLTTQLLKRGLRSAFTQGVRRLGPRPHHGRSGAPPYPGADGVVVLPVGIAAGAPLPGTYPPNAETEAAYTAWRDRQG